jgi:uncharacterized protein
MALRVSVYLDDKTRDELIELAKKGNAEAQYELGWYYDSKRDFNASYEWFYKAAIAGLAKAQYQLGLCFHEGRGVAKDMQQGIKWITLAAKQEDDVAQLALAEILYEIKCSDEKVEFWIKKSIQHGNLRAEYTYAKWLSTNRLDESVSIWRKLAIDHDAHRYQQLACSNLAFYYSNKQMYHQAFIWKLKAVKCNYDQERTCFAIQTLAGCYRQGLGCEKDLDKFRELNNSLPQMYRLYE